MIYLRQPRSAENTPNIPSGEANGGFQGDSDVRFIAEGSESLEANE